MSEFRSSRGTDFLPRLPGLTVADTGELSSTGGPFDKSNQGVNIPGVLSTGLLTAKTSGSGSKAQSLAGVLNLSLTAVAGLINVTADVINAKTKAMCNVYNEQASLAAHR